MMFSTMMRRLPLMYLLIGACLVILTAGLKATASMLNPVLMAIFLGVLLGTTVNALQRRRVPSGVAVTMVILVVVLVGLLCVGFLIQSLRGVADQLPAYAEGLKSQYESLDGQLRAYGVALPDLKTLAVGQAGRGLSIAGATVSAVLGALGNLMLTLFIFAFLLGGVAKMERDVASRADRSEFSVRFLAFAALMRRYMAVRSVLGLVAAVADYILLWALGVDNALLWAALSFLLSFVPNIGFTLSVIPPAIMALLGQGWQEALIVVAGYIIINNIVDNVIGPRYVGAEMKMSALLSFLSVIFWAWVLGPTGAVLAIPITVFLRDVAMGMGEQPGIPAGPVPSSEPLPPAPETAEQHMVTAT
ncbi:MAG TPA: AI-2E family transporter [Longimicrobium sp.]|nr:AI-2E family transporter [Longimicrobium sp.]